MVRVVELGLEYLQVANFEARWSKRHLEEKKGEITTCSTLHLETSHPNTKEEGLIVWKDMYKYVV